MAESTPLPWHISLPDETLILGPDRQIVATTLQDEDDYQANCDRRSADAELIVQCVNTHPAAMAALRESYVALAFAFNRLHSKRAFARWRALLRLRQGERPDRGRIQICRRKIVMSESKIPAKIRVAQDADGFWTCREAVSGSPEFIRADLVEPLVEALEHCQSALAMMIAPDAIKSTSVLHAFARATEAECKARAAILRARQTEPRHDES